MALAATAGWPLSAHARQGRATRASVRVHFFSIEYPFMSLPVVFPAGSVVMFHHDGNHGAPMGRRVQGISLSRRQQAHRWENARCDGCYFFS
jgi:hypothetical protein